MSASASASGASSSSESAWAQFERANNIQTESDAIYTYKKDVVTALRRTRPWKQQVKYFTKVKLSAIALLKMVLHATSGGDLEVMGLLQGYYDEGTFYVLDSFALPVQGTETRVNAQAEAFEYIVNYTTRMEECGRGEGCVGWYHSHPGYGCWLSGIDVGTQSQNQMAQDPWLALVVDPKRTMASGKVDVGAFRTYPDDYVPPEVGREELSNLPASKIEDFGVYVNKYYQLDMSIFKSSVDTQLLKLMWNKYWVNSLCASPLLANRDYLIETVGNVVSQLDAVEGQLQHSGRFGLSAAGKKDDRLAKLTRDSAKVTSEALLGLMNQVVKDVLFNSNKRGVQRSS